MNRTLATLVVAGLMLANVWAQDKPLPLPDKYEQPLGTCFEELRYPYPTAFLNLFVEGQDLRMCFMDVQPTKNPNGRTVVLLHGKNFFGAYWADTAKFLTDRGFRVIIRTRSDSGNHPRQIFITVSFSGRKHGRVAGSAAGQESNDYWALDGRDAGDPVCQAIPGSHGSTSPGGSNWFGRLRVKCAAGPSRAALSAGTEHELGRVSKVYPELLVTYPKDRAEVFVEPRMRVSLSGDYPRWAMCAALTTLMIYQQPVCYELAEIKVPTLLIVGQEDHTAVGKDRAPIDLRRNLGNIPELAKKAARQSRALV